MTESASNAFGEQQVAEAQRLAADGADPNQIANILVQSDPEGADYGIGIVLDGDGGPMRTPKLLTDALARQSLEEARYRNAAVAPAELLSAVLNWQHVPEKHRGEFLLATPSDAGTGALVTGVQLARLIRPDLGELAVEAQSWPAYRAIALSLGMAFSTYELDAEALPSGVLAVMQAGPHNSTGRVASAAEVQRRAAGLGEGDLVVLDRAYPGFEYARDLGDGNVPDLLSKSFDHFVEPFLARGATVILAISTTKAFRTFSLRPCGLLLVFEPDAEKRAQYAGHLAALTRARGSSFQHPATLALLTTMVSEPEALLDVHGETLARLQTVEQGWSQRLTGRLAEYFGTAHGGMFRNVAVVEDAAVRCYAAHVYPVVADGRVRINISGLPFDQSAAARHVKVFEEIFVG